MVCVNSKFRYEFNFKLAEFINLDLIFNSVGTTRGQGIVTELLFLLRNFSDILIFLVNFEGK